VQISLLVFAPKTAKYLADILAESDCELFVVAHFHCSCMRELRVKKKDAM